MPKEIDLPKIKKEFEKGTLSTQIEIYTQLGKWMHEKINEQRLQLAENEKKLQTGK